MTPQVDKALKHVREYYPDVTTVVFNKYATWQYFTDEFKAPTFGNEIDVRILNEAVDSLDELPAVFQI